MKHEKNSLRKIGCAVSLVLMLTTTTPAQNDGKLLRWKLIPGETIEVSFNQEMSMATNLMGNELKSVADMGMVLLWKVDGVAADGTAQISQSIDRLMMKMETPAGEPIQYDSATPGEPEGMTKSLADSIQPLVGVEFSQQMSNRGEILTVELSPQAQAKLAKTPAGAQLSEIFSKDGLKSLLHQAATVLPQEPVRPGDTWQGQSVTKSPVGSLIMDMVYTYRGTEMQNGRPLERIDVDVRLSFGAGANALGLNVAVAEQNNSGTMFFDSTAGRFVQTELRQNMTLETAIGEKKHRQSLNTVMKMQFAQASPVANQFGQQTAQRPAQIVR